MNQDLNRVQNKNNYRNDTTDSSKVYAHLIKVLKSKAVQGANTMQNSIEVTGYPFDLAFNCEFNKCLKE